MLPDVSTPVDTPPVRNFKSTDISFLNEQFSEHCSKSIGALSLKSPFGTMHYISTILDHESRMRNIVLYSSLVIQRILIPVSHQKKVILASHQKKSYTS